MKNRILALVTNLILPAIVAGVLFFVAVDQVLAGKLDTSAKNKGISQKQRSNRATSGVGKESYAIVYLRSNDFDKVLDYKEELDTIFDSKIRNRLRIVGLNGGDFAIIYDGNLSARTVTQTLVKHAELLAKIDFDEPYSTKNENFHTLFNISYGMGRNLDSLKATYQLLYSCLGEEVKRELLIEKTDFNNYLLIYRLRGDEATANALAKRHSELLRGKKLTTSLAKENNNLVVYGESSLIDEDGGKTTSCNVGELADSSRGGAQPESVAGNRNAPASARKEDAKPDKEVAIAVSPRRPMPEKMSTLTKDNDKVERIIADYLDTLRNKGVIDREEATGWMVYDLENDRQLVDINADVQFQAASMIKPFVALAFFHRVKEGRLQYDAASRRQMEAMIQRSSNPATNYFMRKVGGPDQCNAILNKNYGHIFKKTAIKEYIPADGRTYLNSASPADYVRFLRSLWNMELPSGKEIRRVMALPGRDRLYFGTNIPRGTLVYNKTGTTARLCGDMGILVTKTRNGDVYPYAIVGIIERRNKARDYGQWMASRSRVIREVSTLVYEGLRKEHQLL